MTLVCTLPFALSRFQHYTICKILKIFEMQYVTALRFRKCFLWGSFFYKPACPAGRYFAPTGQEQNEKLFKFSWHYTFNILLFCKARLSFLLQIFHLRFIPLFHHSFLLDNIESIHHFAMRSALCALPFALKFPFIIHNLPAGRQVQNS